jgi:putative endonuclease
MQRNGLRAGFASAQLRTLEWLESIVARRSEEPEHLSTGLRGEREAMFHLQELGYKVVAQRWKTPRLKGDLDLIAWDGECLCFIEVKTRTERNPMWPAELAVDDEKRRMLRRMAKAYLKGAERKVGAKPKTRFDVLLVYLSKPAGAEFEVRKGAFGWE